MCPVPECCNYMQKDSARVLERHSYLSMYIRYFGVLALAGMELTVLRAVCWVLYCGSVTRAVLTTDCVGCC